MVNNMKLWFKTLIVSIVLTCCFCKAPEEKSGNLPNVIIIYTDDQAQWAMGAYGNEDIHTPNMDRLTAEGMRFTKGFSKPVCSPSRVMLLTGCYSHRFDVPDYIQPESDRGLTKGTPTIASLLKTKGYTTGLFGKWHLGYGEKFYPELFGFDVAEGFRYEAPGQEWGADEMLTPLNSEYFKFKKEFRSNPLTTDILMERAVNFVQTNRKKPFFLYLATHLPHLPWHPVPECDEEVYRGKPLSVPDTSNFTGITRETVDNAILQSATREYYACVTNVDRNIGKLLDVLDEEDLTDNTLVILIGDNGFMIGHHGLFGKGNARNMYVDEKGSYGGREHGTRPNMFDNSILVPFVVRWPGVVSPGSSNDAMVSTIDILPTLTEINGINTQQMPIDGMSLLPLLKQEKNPEWRSAYFDTYDMIHLGDHGEKPHMRMVRTHDWKLVLYQDEYGDPLDNGTRHELYDLKTDPEELQNLYGTEPAKEKQQDLYADLKEWMDARGLK